MLQVKNCLTQLQNCFTENTHIYSKGNKGTDVLTLDGKHPGLRTVPTIVTAHTFCASPDTRISYRQCLLIHGYFCAV